jgi:transcriptional regulator with XRE-family HTH domain
MIIREMDDFRFGRSVKALRQRRGWRQEDLGQRSGLSRSAISRIELGQVERVAFGDLQKVGKALDARVRLDFWWRGEALDRLVDEEHAAVVDQLVAIFRAAKWDVIVEASFSIFGERGSIDVFAWHPVVQVVAVNEVKATVPEAGGTVIGVDRKSRLAPKIAASRGWTCRGVARFLVVRDGSTARRRIAEHEEIFSTAFPATSRDSLDWIRNPSQRPISGLIFLPDSRPASSRHRVASRKRVRLPIHARDPEPPDSESG